MYSFCRFESLVPGHEGICRPIWLNKNEFFNRCDRGISGFFKLGGVPFLGGPEFHGIIRDDGKVYTTQAAYDKYNQEWIESHNEWGELNELG